MVKVRLYKIKVMFTFRGLVKIHFRDLLKTLWFGKLGKVQFWPFVNNFKFKIIFKST